MTLCQCPQPIPHQHQRSFSVKQSSHHRTCTACAWNWGTRWRVYSPEDAASWDHENREIIHGRLGNVGQRFFCARPGLAFLFLGSWKVQKQRNKQSTLSTKLCSTESGLCGLLVRRRFIVIYTTNAIAKPSVWPPPWWAPVTVAAPTMKTHWKSASNFNTLTHTPGIRTKEQHHRKQHPQGASNHLRIKDRLGFQAQAILVVLL